MTVRTMFRSMFLSASLLALSAGLSQASARDGSALQIIVSKQTQSLTVYDGDRIIASSKVSTGKEGHTTPSGIFSIIQKTKYHESNLYSNAPMPWMQRITWSGVALHESNSVPNRPASHGCVRLPGQFARELYGMTRLGAHVLISDAQVAPAPIEHPFLFTPTQQQQGPQILSDARLRGTDGTSGTEPVEVAMADLPRPKPQATMTGQPPLSLLITFRGETETIHDAQLLLQDMGFETGGHDGHAGPLTRMAIQGFKRWKGLPLKGPLITPTFLSALYQTAGKPIPPVGQIYARQAFKPVFDAPIVIDQPEKPLGTHFFAANLESAGGKAHWQVTSLEPASTVSNSSIVAIGKAQPSATDGLDTVFNRIHIPDDIRERIETTMRTGTVMTITDHGLSPDTVDGTDFITYLPG
ncbi:L,D-transpeptidase family protein [Agrobacterium vitis]|uniref:L,D-transpeptidase family protein n=1 Tax=Agrobacterium vitis TaxID=373 RepID=UPI001572E221|nr:L,D-transpeptidase family protein [Agrobacterium vitis]NSZ16418.1 L,D-transpeptidase [Agrobacterium vitis]QZO05190.1 L,D-transpeptidase [Agrobacterium vitis]UJL87338.1 L,D-transpeptidase [Agrobacterium vitis]